MAEDPHSLKNKLRSSLCLSCCFPQHHSKPRIVHSSSLHRHRKSSRSFSDLPHLKEKCCNFISRIGRHHHHHHRTHSADFHYDALSYSLNFEDDAIEERSADDLKSFSAKLPPSPRKTTSSTTSATAAVTNMEIAALS